MKKPILTTRLKVSLFFPLVLCLFCVSFLIPNNGLAANKYVFPAFDQDINDGRDRGYQTDVADNNEDEQTTSNCSADTYGNKYFGDSGDEENCDDKAGYTDGPTTLRTQIDLSKDFNYAKLNNSNSIESNGVQHVQLKDAYLSCKIENRSTDVQATKVSNTPLQAAELTGVQNNNNLLVPVSFYGGGKVDANGVKDNILRTQLNGVPSGVPGIVLGQFPNVSSLGTQDGIESAICQTATRTPAGTCTSLTAPARTLASTANAKLKGNKQKLGNPGKKPGKFRKSKAKKLTQDDSPAKSQPPEQDRCGEEPYHLDCK